MRIDKEFPPPIELKKLELDTLKFLLDEPYIQREFMSLFVGAKDNYYSYSDRQRLINLAFNYCLDFELKWEQWILHFYIGSLIETAVNDSNRYSRVCYDLNIARKKDDKNVLKRKFHFDYVEDGDRNDHPIFHLQYSGRLQPSLAEKFPYYDSQFFSALDEPRVSCQPMTLALLLNLIFKEFNCDKTQRLNENSKWNDLIKTNEKKVLGPYFNYCNKFVQNHLSSSCLFSKHFCYGKSI